MPKRGHEGIRTPQLPGRKPSGDGNQGYDHEGGVAAERIQHAVNLQERDAARKRGRGKGGPSPELNGLAR